MTQPPNDDTAALRTELNPVLATDGMTVRVVGLGGTGAITSRYLAIFLASLPVETRLVLIDGDRFEPRNATRMLFGEYGNKAAVIRNELLSSFADSRLTLSAVEQFLTPDNIANLLPGEEDNIVVLCVDNHATRKLASDYCAGKKGWDGLQNVCLISGGNDGVGPDSAGRMLRGTYGNCQVYIRRDRTNLTPPLTDFHNEISEPADRLPSEAHCTDLLESVPQLLFANLMTASAISNTFWLYLCDALHYSEVVFDIADARMRPLAIPGPRPVIDG